MEKQRNSSVELLRIICMLLIVVHHIINAHYHDETFGETDYYVSRLLKSFVVVAVNTFVFVSGYYGIRFKISKFLKLESQTLFYSIGLFVLMSFLGYHTVQIRRDILFFIPIISKEYWFVTCYAVLFFLSPFLNWIAANCPRLIFRYFIICGFVLFYCVATICYAINGGQIVNDAGLGIVNMGFIYMMARYVSRFQPALFKKARPSYCLVGYISICLLSFLSHLSMTCILGFEFESFYGYNSVYTLLAAICFAMAFICQSFNYPLINNLAKCSFSVYLFHLHPCLWPIICEMLGISSLGLCHYLIAIVVLPVAIYLVAFLIESIRRFVFFNMESILADSFESLFNKAKQDDLSHCPRL